MSFVCVCCCLPRPLHPNYFRCGGNIHARPAAWQQGRGNSLSGKFGRSCGRRTPRDWSQTISVFTKTHTVTAVYAEKTVFMCSVCAAFASSTDANNNVVSPIGLGETLSQIVGRAPMVLSACAFVLAKIAPKYLSKFRGKIRTEILLGRIAWVHNPSPHD